MDDAAILVDRGVDNQMARPSVLGLDVKHLFADAHVCIKSGAHRPMIASRTLRPNRLISESAVGQFEFS